MQGLANVLEFHAFLLVSLLNFADELYANAFKPLEGRIHRERVVLQNVTSVCAYQRGRAIICKASTLRINNSGRLDGIGRIIFTLL